MVQATGRATLVRVATRECDDVDVDVECARRGLSGDAQMLDGQVSRIQSRPAEAVTS
jgi:hypothetical protein